ILIEQKENDKKSLESGNMDDDKIRTFEEVFRQISFLKKLKEMASQYGFDISEPAKNAKEAIQWLYFAYLAAIKEQNG
ncbi:MAG: pyruvate formate lyase family protein, partial [Oscillospiraceae bacterium]